MLLDPPTFSQSKEHSVFRAEEDYGQLVAVALPAGWEPEKFLTSVADAVRASRRTILQQHYFPHHLKTVWLRIR